MRRLLLLGLISLLLSLTGSAQDSATTYYLRNRAVQGRQAGGDVFVRIDELDRYLSRDEIAHVEVDRKSGQIRVDGRRVATLDSNSCVPLVSLVKNLGYEVRTNQTTGIIDLTPPAVLASAAANPAPPPLAPEQSRLEYQLASHRMEMILKTQQPYDDPDMIARVESVGQRVVRVTPLANLAWHFYVVNSRIPNAACVGEGHVFVNRGLLDMGISDDELAGVLGHEIAHGVRRHPFHRLDLARDMVTLLVEYEGLRKELTSSGAKSPSLTNRVQAYERSRDALQYRMDNQMFYSRQDEEDADILGMRYAVAAGYSADGLGNCLIKLQKAVVEQFGVGILKDDMSHPPVKRRLEILQKVRASWNL